MPPTIPFEDGMAGVCVRGRVMARVVYGYVWRCAPIREIRMESRIKRVELKAITSSFVDPPMVVRR